MQHTVRQTRDNRTITGDFQSEATYVQRLGNGKAVVEAGGGRYLVRGEAMIPDHVLQPGTQLFVAGRLPEVPGLIVTRCLQGYG